MIVQQQAVATFLAATFMVMVYLYRLEFISPTIPWRTQPPHPLGLATNLPPFGANIKCPRFVVETFLANPGLGHNFGGIVLAAKQAKDVGAALVIDELHWGGSGSHGAYPYLRRLFGLYKFLSLSEFKAVNASFARALQTRQVASREELYALFSNTSACHFQVDIQASSKVYCNNGYCFDRWPGVYAEMQPFFRHAPVLDVTLSLAAQYFNISSVDVRNVVWHLRVSDLPLHKNDTTFFSNLSRHIISAAEHASLRLNFYFFYGDKSYPNHIGHEPPDGYKFLSQMVPGAVYVSSNRYEVDLYHFVKADILVGSGSSFVHAAATVAPERLIYIEVPPKESKALYDDACRTFHLQDVVIADMTGAVCISINKLGELMLEQPSAL